jgi:hypothetical protein
MNYNELGKEYLSEAERLKGRIRPLQRQAKILNCQAASKLYRRIAILNDMYLDCLHTGRYLCKAGRMNETKIDIKS